MNPYMATALKWTLKEFENYILIMEGFFSCKHIRV